MSRRKVSLDALLKRHKPRHRAVRRWFWRHGKVATWLLDSPLRPKAADAD